MVRIQGAHYVETEKCSTCGTLRERKIHRTSGYLDGAVYKRTGENRAAYDLPKGLGRMTRDAFGMLRLERIERHLRAIDGSKKPPAKKAAPRRRSSS